MESKLTVDDFNAAAAFIGCAVSVIKAMYSVETNGSGLLDDGRLKILFEGHVFYKQLEDSGYHADKFTVTHPTIVYPKWTRKHYIGGAAEYGRLSAAIEICKSINAPEMLALNSASYGSFQIMGYNCTDCGYATAQEMITTWNNEGEKRQLIDFAKYIKKVGLDDELRAITADPKNEAKYWAAVAYKYNGPGYKGSLKYDWDDYDLKLANAYKLEKSKSV